MPGANGDRKGVRFAVQDGLEDEDSGHRHRRPPPSRHATAATTALRAPLDEEDEDDDDEEPSSFRNSSQKSAIGRHQSKKRPRPERNVDEIDDVDDWRPEDDGDGEGGGGAGFLSEKALLEAKRTRRLRRANQLPSGDGFDDDGDNDDGEGSGKALGGGLREANRWDKTMGASLLDADAGDDNDGIPITPFNMDQEENDGDGYFDGDTYVFRQGGRGAGDEEPDAWADASDDEFNEASASVPTTNGASTRRTGNEQSGPNFDEWTEHELYARIVPLVSDTETVTAAIVRYGGLIRHQSKSSTGESSTKSPASLRAQEALNELTEASSALLLKGQVDIYQKTRADLLRLLPDRENDERGEADVRNPDNQTTTAKKKVVQWEYMGNEDRQIHGPYTSEQMRQWISAGYFVGASAVQIRPILSEDRVENDVTLQDDLMNDLMDDDDDQEDGVGDGEKPAAASGQVRGEWQQSDRVDFSQYE